MMKKIPLLEANRKYPEFLAESPYLKGKFLTQKYDFPILSDYQIEAEDVPMPPLLSDQNVLQIREALYKHCPRGSSTRILGDEMVRVLWIIFYDKPFTHTFRLNQTLLLFDKRHEKGTKLHSLIEAMDEVIKADPQGFPDRLRSAVQRLLTLTVYSRKKRMVVISSSRWDLATMSMRGIKSCMNWDNHHREQLIGSMLDPACNIAYITDRADTEYGQKMIYRALLRTVRSRESQKYHILIDRLYTSYGHLISKQTREKVRSILKDAIRAKMEDALEDHILVSGVDRMSDYYIPMVDEVHQLPTVIRSCVDSGVSYIREVKW